MKTNETKQTKWYCKNGNVPGLLTFNLVKERNKAKTSDPLLIEVHPNRNEYHCLRKVEFLYEFEVED